MITRYHKLALAAAFGLAISFTLSCSPDDGEDNPSSGSNVGISSSSVNNYSSSSSGGSSSSKMGGSSSSDTPSSSSLQSSSSQVIVPVYGDPIFDTRDGQSYPTVVMGGQTWMAKNLNYATGGKCGNGSSLSDENTASCDAYGRLYDWATANSVCPTDWHLSSKAEWDALIDFVGKETAATKLKAVSGWYYPNGRPDKGTDDYGFAALPGGTGGYPAGSFKYADSIGVWWTATIATELSNVAHTRGIFYERADVYIGADVTYMLYSVRCVKN